MDTPNTNGDAEQYYHLPIDLQRQQPISTPSSSGSMLPRIEAPEPQQLGLIVAFSHKLMHITILERFVSDLGNWHTFYIKAFLAATYRNILSFRRSNGSWDTERMPEYLLTRLGRIHPTALDEYMKSRERLPCDFLVEMILVSIEERVKRGQRNIMFTGFPGSEEFLRKFCEMIRKPNVIIGFDETPRLSGHGFDWAGKPEYSDEAVVLDLQGVAEDQAYRVLQQAFMARVFPKMSFPATPSKKPYTLKRDSAQG
ncbi:hypothetical protein Slin15195_G108190 [Septoria linicola]|uniref:Uncharacterized protein n=1 Tax=Septoria linicola TaxID=215465 RepID=A0A9Q9AYK6_9PEZI|nr:hypothetical protein Slin15195_G108190 [Septoria linicola]